MTADSGLAVQAALYEALDAALGGGVYDHVPQGTDFPYVVIGDARAQPFDTQGFSGNDVTATVHVYSQARGYAEAKTLLGQIHAALHEADFGVDGHVMVFCRHIDTNVFAEGDGETRHGVIRFRIVTEPI